MLDNRALTEPGSGMPEPDTQPRTRPRGQLLKWIGNKFRHAEIIAAHLPDDLGVYYEPFAGTSAVAATLQPADAVASDALPELVGLFELVQDDPESLLQHYEEWSTRIASDGEVRYVEVRDRFNASRTPEDLLVLSRTCWGGVMRFTLDGKMSTPIGPHRPMAPAKLAGYVDEWQHRLAGVDFRCQDFADTMALAAEGDTVYCDPPYVHGQGILYGAQGFELTELWDSVRAATGRGARVAVSLDGFRKSGAEPIVHELPDQLFARELLIDGGGCMLRRFQASGDDMRLEQVSERLLLSW
jgi:DNA adenine methylase